MTRPDVKNWRALSATLKDDILQAGRLFNSSDRSPFSRRVYVRAVFAQVEAWVHIQKQLVLHSAPWLQDVPTAAERALLSEESYEVSDKGEAETRKGRFIPLDRNVRLVFGVVARCFGVLCKLEVGGDEWQAFRTAIQIRNRLTHPKQVEDLSVSDQEVVTVTKAQRWFYKAAMTLMRDISSSLGPRR